MLSDGTHCYQYNEANQVSKVIDCSTNQFIAEYSYDHDGKRVVKKEYENGQLQHAVYYIGKHFETTVYPDRPAESVSYYYANNERIARKDPDETKFFYYRDHLGSTSVLTDENGNLVEKTKYFPYGLDRTGGTQSKFLYTGQEKDIETGLYYYGARYYDPKLIRFTQPDSIIPDPYDPQQLNRYSYVRNNPLRYTDPTGNYIDTAVDIVSIGISINDVVNDPGNAWNWVALGADVVTTALPGACGGGLAVKALTKGDDAIDAAKILSKTAGDITRHVDDVIKNAGRAVRENPVLNNPDYYVGLVGPFKDMRLVKSGGSLGIEAHHLIPKSLITKVLHKANREVMHWDSPSIILTKSQHDYITNKWRRHYGNIKSPDDLVETLKEVYKDAGDDLLMEMKNWMRAKGFKWE
jgi:RHS repeat-associated protein